MLAGLTSLGAVEAVPGGINECLWMIESKWQGFKITRSLFQFGAHFHYYIDTDYVLVIILGVWRTQSLIIPEFAHDKEVICLSTKMILLQSPKSEYLDPHSDGHWSKILSDPFSNQVHGPVSWIPKQWTYFCNPPPRLCQFWRELNKGGSWCLLIYDQCSIFFEFPFTSVSPVSGGSSLLEKGFQVLLIICKASWVCKVKKSDLLCSPCSFTNVTLDFLYSVTLINLGNI